ncbi:MAG: DoxX family membrane protein [Desulfobacteraceae bacterium]|nr:DoxX family membrane protein [Desulfobacteraceae bacterium]
MRAILFVKTVLTHPYLAFILRLYIAGVFIYASMYKFNYTAQFAESIASYQIAPYWAINIVAVTLPWVELISGILLIAGFRSRSATVVIGSLLIFFTLAIIVNLMRGNYISCGCFQATGGTISWWIVGRDIIWLMMTIQVFFYDKAFHLENRFRLAIKEI